LYNILLSSALHILTCFFFCLVWLHNRRDTIDEVPDSYKSGSHEYEPPSHKKEPNASAQLWARSAYDEDELPEEKHKTPRAPGILTTLFSLLFGQRESRVAPGGETEDEREDSPKGVFRPLFNAMRTLSHKSRTRKPHEEKKAAGSGPFKLYSSTSTMSLATASSGDPTSVHSRSTSRRVPMLALLSISNS
jgi:hypothetical protein